MVEVEEMLINVTSVASGDTSPLNVLKMNKLGRGEHMLFNPTK